LFIKKIKNIILIRDDYFRFGLVFIKKITKPNFFLKKPKPVQTDRFRFGSVRFFRTKTGSNRFFPVLAPFFLGLAPFFSGLARFGFGSVFLIFCLKNRNRIDPAGFFKILIGLIGFFYGSVFSVIFFWFSQFNQFFGFFLTPNFNIFSIK
jgi:hypothetical protein